VKHDNIKTVHSCDYVNINECSGYSLNNQEFVTTWATDLMPKDKYQYSFKLGNQKHNVYFVGTKQGDEYAKFSDEITKLNYKIFNIGGYTGNRWNISHKILKQIGISGFISHKKSIKIQRESSFGFDIREKQHLSNGYIPCRLFKLISYGRYPYTNSVASKKFFGEMVNFSNVSDINQELLEAELFIHPERLHYNSQFILRNHTYVNRVMDFNQLGIRYIY
jgi:hypothetical protein